MECFGAPHPTRLEHCATAIREGYRYRYDRNVNKRSYSGRGTAVGLAVGKRMPERMSQLSFRARHLHGVHWLQDGRRTRNVLVALFAIVIGTAIGTALDIEGWLERIAVGIERRFAKGGSGLAGSFLAASLLYCVGPMSIMAP